MLIKPEAARADPRRQLSSEYIFGTVFIVYL